jgi:transcriptional regulator with XRE-family HTH domain
LNFIVLTCLSMYVIQALRRTFSTRFLREKKNQIGCKRVFSMEPTARQNQEAAETLGQFLRRERNLKGISLREISDSTKIAVRFLEAMEEDKYEVLPPRAFVIGFIRAYTQCLRLDSQKALALYEKTVSPSRPAREVAEKRDVGEEDQRLKRALLIVFVGMVSASLFYVVFLKDWSPKVRKPKAVTSSLKPAHEESGAPALARTFEPRAQGGAEELAASKTRDGRPLVLEVVALEETWVRVERDEAQADALLLQKGQRRRWEARDHFVLTIGNVPGTRLYLNGQPVELPATRSRTLHNLVLPLPRPRTALK